MEMTIDDNGTVRTLSFFYDNSSPYAVKVTSGGSSSTYYYVLNLQGDVTAIVNSAGKTVVEYTYDPWGKLLSIDGEYKNGLGIRNPLRYRGYVYDTETQLYYLQSRYYDPTTCRFISADAYASTGQGLLGHNMFAYCLNCPTVHVDASGSCACTAKGGISPSAKYAALCCVCGGTSGDPNFIYGQENEPYGSIPIGFWLPIAGQATVADAGCGPVAVYNALLLLGERDVTFKSILSYYKKHDAFLVNGYLGSLPKTAISCIEAHGYKVINLSYFDMMNTVGDISHTADACIIWYEFPQSDFPGFGLHFVAYKMNGTVGTYYNHYNTATKPLTLPGTISSFLDHEQSIYARILLIYKKE